MNEPQARNGAHVAPPTPQRPWTAGGLLPDALGLAFVAVLVAGLVGAGFSAREAATRHAAAVESQCATLLARTLAAAISAGEAQDASALRSLLGGSWAAAPQYSARWLDANGAVRFESDAGGWQAGPGHQVCNETIRSPSGEVLGQVEVAYRPLGLVTEPGYWREWWLVTGAVLAGFLLLFRKMRVVLRPAAAVQRNLTLYARGLENDLRALTLSDALGETARAWNTLVSELAGTRGHAGAENGNGSGRNGKETHDVLQRFESRRLREVLDQLPFGVVRVAADRRVAYANAAAAELLGRDVQSLTGEFASGVVEDQALGRLLGDGGPLPARGVTLDRVLGEGEAVRAARLTVVPLSGPSGDGERLVTIQDTSHMHEAERARDNFLYHVTHELRTPLTNIQAYAETLTRPDFDDEQTRKECYNIIISETRRLTRLVEDILSVSQLEVGTARVELGDVDLVRLLRQTVQDHLGSADEKTIELTLKLPPKAPNFRGDKQRLAVLFNNLIGNAVKYTPSGGRVQVTMEADDGAVRVAVVDTGIGIPAEDLPHVFEKFVRASNTVEPGIPGTGLGLSIAREVARVHGGDIQVTSEVGRGSTFTVELPLGTV